MKVVYTRHAKNRMRWRKISREDVESAIDDPDRKEYIDGSKFHMYKVVGKRHLRITIAIENNTIIVISAVAKRH